jgi:3-dehydroquinate dehydratase / shikimate dehydrogenase
MRHPLLCDVIAAPTMAELRARRDAVVGADLVELRLDMVDRPDVAGALQGRRTPLIVTCRAAWEGGHFTGSEDERQRILREALEAGAEFVDIEWRAPDVERWLRPQDRARVILSRHDFDGMPSDLAALVGRMRGAGAGVVKVAGRADALRDLLPMLALGRAQAASERTVLIAMGTCGMASRILAAHFGSCWTYAGPAVAPGQIEARRLLREFRFQEVRADTRVYGVVGRPIAHSISPAIHNAAFAAVGIDAVYIPCEAAGIEDFLALADVLPIAGASVTAPFKLAARDRGQPADDDVRRVGAANTLRRGAAGWECRNTDVAGFLAPLVRRMSLRGAKAAILGTGGAARAAAVGLGRSGAMVTVHGRNATVGPEVAALAGGSFREWKGVSPDWDLLVNTTPIGTFPAVTDTPFEGPFGASMSGDLPTGETAGARRAPRVVYDLVYNPRPTRLLREAAAGDCVTLDGLDMLVAQAAHQFTWWTGRAAPVDIMRAAAERRLAEMAEAQADSCSAGLLALPTAGRPERPGLPITDAAAE